MTSIASPSLNYCGSLFIVSAPSGAGKSSLIQALLKQEPFIALSISYTTRSPRVGEVNGQHYHFVNHTQFEALRLEGEFLEYAQVHNNFYGTSKTGLASQLAAGQDVLLEIDWQGAQQVKAHFKDMMSVFILPPSLTALKQRLNQRGQDSESVIEQRLHNASDEIKHAPEFDYVLVNETFEVALTQLQMIVKTARLRFKQQAFKQNLIFKAVGL